MGSRPKSHHKTGSPFGGGREGDMRRTSSLTSLGPPVVPLSPFVGGRVPLLK